MTIAERELAMIGFGGGRTEPVVWDVARLNTAMHGERDEADLASSKTLMYWQKLLAPSHGRSPYRTRRIGKN